MGIPNIGRVGVWSPECRFGDQAAAAEVDALLAWGSATDIAARVKAHHDLGADHVCIQVISATGLDGARAAWRELAGVLL